MLQILQMLQPNAFDGIATGDESWFQDVYMSNSMFAPSRDLAATSSKDADRTKKTMLTIFFTSRRLIVLEALPKGTKSLGPIGFVRLQELDEGVIAATIPASRAPHRVQIVFAPVDIAAQSRNLHFRVWQTANWPSKSSTTRSGY
jgi:hypothetical protein